MNTLAKSIPSSSIQTMLGIFPYMAFGLVSIASHFGDTLPRYPIWLHPFLVFDALMLIGLGVGILAGFPRWAYSYLFWEVIMAWWLSDMVVYGIYRLDNRIWLLPVILFVMALIEQRSLAPMRTLIAGLWNDWTLLSLGMYSFFAWLGVMYDENHHPCLLVFIIASTFAVSVGAWFYFRQSAAIRRVLSLIAGLSTLVVISGINNATWDWRAYYNLPETTYDINPIGAVFFALILALMYLTGYLSQKRQTGA